MEIKISEAKGRLTDLVRRAESGEDVVLTRHGHPAVRLVPVTQRRTDQEKRDSIDAIVTTARAKIRPGPDAAHSADFLYDGDGLPG